MNFFNKMICVVAFFAFAVTHANGATQKIGIVNVQAVFQELPQAALIQQEITAEFKDDTAAINALEGDLTFNMEKRTRDAATMSDAQIKALEDEIVAQRQKYAEDAQVLRQKMQARFGEERNKILALIKQTIDAIAAEDDYDLVLNANAVTYIKKANDISEKVVERVSKIK